jgi:hypothetical protein
MSAVMTAALVMAPNMKKFLYFLACFLGFLVTTSLSVLELALMNAVFTATLVVSFQKKNPH